MKQHRPTLTIVPDWPARVELQNRALAERREEARKDVGRIIYLWQTRQWQEKHTEPPKESA